MIGAAANVGLNLALIPTYGMIGAAWANAAAYALQSAIAYHYSQRFYPITYERGRIARAVGAAEYGYAAADHLPGKPPLPGLVARGFTVVAIMFGSLAVTGFFHPDELRWLNSLRLKRRRPDAAVAPVVTTEMAGEIVSVEIPDELLTPPAAEEQKR